MLNYWASTDHLTRVNFWLQAVVAVFGFVTAIAGVSSWIVSTRLATLQDAVALDKDRRLEQAEETARTIRDYADMAGLDAFGLDLNPGEGILYSTTISNVVKPFWVKVGDRWHPRADPEAEKAWRTAIERFPRFPFGYYCLAMCLKARNDPEWKSVADKAVVLFKHTTKIAGHKNEHDQALQDLLKQLEATTTTTPQKP